MNVFTREGFIFLNGKDYTIHEIRVYQIIAHAPNLQEGEHCVSLFMVLTKYYGSIFAFSTFKFFSLCSFSSHNLNFKA